MGSTVWSAVSCGGQWGQEGSADAQLHRSGSSSLTGGQDAVSIVSVMLLTREIISFMCGWEQTVVQERACPWQLVVSLPAPETAVTPEQTPWELSPETEPCLVWVYFEHSCDTAGQRFIPWWLLSMIPPKCRWKDLALQIFREWDFLHSYVMSSNKEWKCLKR